MCICFCGFFFNSDFIMQQYQDVFKYYYIVICLCFLEAHLVILRLGSCSLGILQWFHYNNSNGEGEEDVFTTMSS